VVLPDRKIDNGYVLVGDGKVHAVGSGDAPAGEKHGGPGFLVLPGAIDAQVHSRSQLGQEDFVWSTRSSAAGGVTTIVDMPYDDSCLIAIADRFRDKIKEAGEQARVDYALYATIDPEEGPARVDELWMRVRRLSDSPPWGRIRSAFRVFRRKPSMRASVLSASAG
jgi:allantoinase